MSKITRIRFSARFQVDDRSEVRVQQADFKLGLGPCGKEVTELETSYGEHMMEVMQGHSDGTAKRFVYPIAHLTGRVEETYGN